MERDLYGSDLQLLVESIHEGFGLGVDIHVAKSGDIGTVSGRKNLGQAILHRLLTRKGELIEIGHPDYGSRLHELIGEPNNERTRELVSMYIKECLIQEPRVKEIVELKITPLRDNRSAVTVDITVLPIKSKVPMNLVFPFYLEVV
jgi:phage baseplate assembly protein W